MARYHADFSSSSQKFRIVSHSVDRVRIAPDGATAEVTYRTVARLPGGGQLPVSQRTGWKRVDGTWYRAIGEPEKILECR